MACVRWLDDPCAGLDHLVSALEKPALLDSARADLGLALARMALRLGESDLVARGIATFHAHRREGGPPMRMAERAWAGSLLADPSGAATAAAAVLVALPIVVAYILLQGQFMRGFLTGAIRE